MKLTKKLELTEKSRLQPIKHLESFVVMDDDPNTSNNLRRILSAIGCEVYTAKSEEEVLEFARDKGIQNFILDIDMGPRRGQEGFDALEKVKKVNANAYAGFLTAHPSRYEKRAQRLNADFFQPKTDDSLKDVHAIIQKRLLQVQQEIAELLEQSTLAPVAVGAANPQVEMGPVETGAVDMVSAETNTEVKPDVNIVAFQKHLQDSKWRMDHEGCYVAFIDGEFVDEDWERRNLLARLRTRFPNARRFLAKVENQDSVEYLVSPLLVRPA